MLCGTFRSVYTDLCAAASVADPAALAAVNPFPPALPDFPTSGEFVAYLLTGHLGYHLGQLVAWRAAAGSSTAVKQNEAPKRGIPSPRRLPAHSRTAGQTPSPSRLLHTRATATRRR